MAKSSPGTSQVLSLTTPEAQTSPKLLISQVTPGQNSQFSLPLCSQDTLQRGHLPAQALGFKFLMPILELIRSRQSS